MLLHTHSESFPFPHLLLRYSTAAITSMVVKRSFIFHCTSALDNRDNTGKEGVVDDVSSLIIMVVKGLLLQS